MANRSSLSEGGKRFRHASDFTIESSTFDGPIAWYPWFDFIARRIFFLSDVSFHAQSFNNMERYLQQHQDSQCNQRHRPFLLSSSALWLCIGALSFAQVTSAEPVEAVEAVGNNYRDSILRLDPMNTVNVDRDMASILNDFYESNYTDSETWDKVESIRFEGELITPQGSFGFIAYQKKPDYCKIALFHGEAPLLVMAYDGQEAWQMDFTQSEDAVMMPKLEALNFIRDAPVGGHLFYPQIPGKTIVLKGVALVADRRCFELLITLPDGQQITSMLGMTDFREHQLVTTNAVTGKREVTTHTKFLHHQGIRLPACSELTIEDELVHTLVVNDVVFNEGVMPWMFVRSSGELLKGTKRERFQDLEYGLGASLAELNQVQTSDPSKGDAFSPFAPPSAFNLSIEEVLSPAGEAVEAP